MAKEKYRYVCPACGEPMQKKDRHCFQCNEYDGEPDEILINPEQTVGMGRYAQKVSGPPKIERLNEVEEGEFERFLTGDQELDRLLGGGAVVNEIVLVDASPGTGKTTLLTQAASYIAKAGKKVLYISGEENGAQVKNRAVRVCSEISDNYFFSGETEIHRIEKLIIDNDIEFFVIDSLQKILNADLSDKVPGGTAMMKSAMQELVRIVKNSGRRLTCFAIRQRNKDESASGPNSVSHDCDCVISIDRESIELRVGTVSKNRFGDTAEVGLWTMEADGMKPLDDLTFVVQREKPVPGVAVASTIQGNRPVLVEVQSLVYISEFSNPERIPYGISRDKLKLQCAVLSKGVTVEGGMDSGLSLDQRAVVVQTVSGLKIRDTGADLGIDMAIVSSYSNEAIPQDVAFIGEVSVVGEIMNVPFMDQRVADLERRGYKKVIVPYRAKLVQKHDNIEVVRCRNLSEVIMRTLPKAIKMAS